jgi:hypothetical protein
MPDYSLILTINYQNTSWSLNGDSYDGLTWYSDTPKPTQAELDALWPSTQETIDKQTCKQDASKRLFDTDWTTIADVANPVNSPYLSNQADFIVYRNAVRKLAVNPVVNPVFPNKPNEIWK